MVLDPLTFDQQMNRLKVLPTQGGFEDEQAFASRKLIYYPVLSDLDTGAFVAGCAELLKRSKWFPVPKEIRDEAEAWAPVVDTKALPRPSALSPEELEQDREERRQRSASMLTYVRAELAKRGEMPPSKPGPGAHTIDLMRDVSGTFRTIEDTAERRAELARQAKEIKR